jgi:immunity protein 35 of polymorphic toxin system
MINREQAEAIVSDEVEAIARSSGVPLVLLVDATLDEGYGWVFFYEAREYREPGEEFSELVGNAPILVLAESGETRTLGVAYPLEHYLEPYRAAQPGH